MPSGIAAGATTITVTDSASPPNSASIAFTVYHATIAVSPTTVTSNSMVTVSGSGVIAATTCTVPSTMPTGTFDLVAYDGSITATGNSVTVN